MSTTITEYLRQRFEDRNQRVVIWHDPKGQYSEEVSNIDVGDVTLLRVDNNEFGVKARILTSGADEKFLVYRAGELPPLADNWLLDLELAYGIFSADRSSLLVNELEIDDPSLVPTLEEYSAFFNSKERTSALHTLIQNFKQTGLPLNADRLQALMCQVVVKGADHRLRSMLQVVLEECSKDSVQSLEQLEHFGLDTFFWDGIRSIYHYDFDDNSVKSLIAWLFQRAFEGFAGDYAQIQVDFDWMIHDNRQQPIIRKLADDTYDDLKLESKLESLPVAELASIDVFRQIDLKLIEKLAEQIANSTTAAALVSNAHHQRQNTLWYSDYAHTYKALEYAATLLELTRELPTSFDSPKDGFDYYVSAGYKVDQLYRHFLQELDDSEDADLLAELKEKVETAYVGTFLFRTSQRWQQKIGELEKWTIPGIPAQSDFFEEFVLPRVTGQKKLAVIISDALRFEFGEELAENFNSQTRYSTELYAMLGCVPSYTQLGMAALLPHKSLSLQDDGAVVYADGKPTNGLPNRSSILETVDGQAIQAEAVLKKSGEELREFVASKKILYIYHNYVDATGDDAKTESRVLRDGDHALKQLDQLVKKLVNANFNNLLVTADHGFLYQDSDLQPWAFVSDTPKAASMPYSTGRRHLLGHDFVRNDSSTTFTADQLGLEGNLEVQVANGIQRFPQPGPGSRYVHGGASLQEIVVPVVAINKGRADDTQPAGVRLVLRTNLITTGQVLGEVFQEDPVGRKILPRTVKVGVYGGDTLISTIREFDINRTSENARDRHFEFQLTLTPESEDFNRATNVAVVMHGWLDKAKRWDVLASVDCTINRSFTSDFDF